MRKEVEKNKVVIADGLVYIHMVGKYESRIAITDIKSYLKHELNKYKWVSTKGGYVYTYVNGQIVYMHRLITGNTSSKLHTDHIGNSDDPVKDKLDNRACNLRKATNRQNQNNSRLKVDNTTGYKGVSLDKVLYKAQTKLYGRKYYFGGFSTKKYVNALLMAAYCYDIASEWVNGKYAQHNGIKESGLLTEEEIRIVEVITFNNINKHQLVKYEDIEVIEPANIYTRKIETVSIGVETIS